LDVAFDEGSSQLKTGDLLSRSGSQLSDLLHQRLGGRHFFFSQDMPPGHPGSKITSGTKFFEPKSLPGSGLVLGIEPFCPPEWNVFGCPQVKVINLWPHDAVKTTRLIG
jgi:hypothetical protein